jgi:hypothetical protein
VLVVMVRVHRARIDAQHLEGWAACQRSLIRTKHGVHGLGWGAENHHMAAANKVQHHTVMRAIQVLWVRVRAIFATDDLPVLDAEHSHGVCAAEVGQIVSSVGWDRDVLTAHGISLTAWIHAAIASAPVCSCPVAASITR